ncbi:MAG: TolC family protein [Proteobacteria bacterium]|jgi:outer membrane protein TolC|nr:TolC family protein [Pseudomonadota bacterium]
MLIPSFVSVRYSRERSPFLFRFVIAVVAPLTAMANDVPLSLLDAVKLAETRAPNISAREAAVTAAERAVTPAGQLPDPQLVVGIDNLPVDTSDAFHLNRDFMTMRKVGVMQTFVRKEKRELRTQRATAMVAREGALLTNERLSTREAVARAWVMRTTAERRLALLQTLRPRIEAQIAAATAALSGGRGTAADGIAARSELALLEDRISEAARSVAETRAEFARWLPDAGERPLGEAPDWRDLGAAPDALIHNIAHHRELLTYDAAEQAANAEVALARADKRPDWSLVFAYAQRGPQYSNMISLEARVDLPLFSRNRQDPMIAAKQALVDQIAAEREAARRMHTADLQKTLAAWRSANERMQRYEKEILPLADDRADAALAAYRGGRGDLQASLSAIDKAIEQRLAYADLLSTLGQSWAALYFAFPQEH